MNLIQSITVTPKHITLMLGQWYYSAKAEICPSGCVSDAVVWYSDNEEIAGVNQDNGFISANGVGTTRIYAITTDGNALTDYLTVTVIPVPVEGICINEGDITLHNGTHCTLTAAVYPSNATNKEVEWYSEDERIAYVDPPSGVVFANKVGQTKICAVSKQNGHVRGCCTVTVIPPIPVTGVQITSSAPQTMKVGDTATLVARVLPSNATNQTVIWSSSDPSVATVNAETGEVTVHKVGVVHIFATAQENSEIYDLVTIYRDRYVYELINTFSFPEEVALLIRSLYDRVDALFPNETSTCRAWMCARLLGGVVYGNETSGSMSKLKWENVASKVFTGSEEKYFTETLGYTTCEYTTITGAIAAKHNLNGTPDFAHTQITLAARLTYTLDKDGILSNIYTWSSDLTVSHLAGWLGDATLLQDGTTAFGNADYCADLDAENIYRYIIQGQSSVDAINTYYAELTTSYNRAHKFLSYISYDTVEEMVFEEFGYNPTNTDHWDEIKTLYPDTYNFLKSLENQLPNIQVYP